MNFTKYTKYIVYIRTIQGKTSVMVNRTRINSAQSIFLEYHPSSSNITCCQVSSSVKQWFYDSAGDIDYQLSLSQSESNTLHESII